MRPNKSHSLYPWQFDNGDLDSHYFKAVTSPLCTYEDIRSQVRLEAHSRGIWMEDEL